MTRTNDATFDEADLNGFVDGRIDPARSNALAESLASDSEARTRLDGWKRQNESLRTMFASVLYEPVPARLMAHTVPTRPDAAEEAMPRGPSQGSGLARGVLVTTSVGMALVGFALGALASLGLANAGLSHPAAPALGDAAIEQRSGDRPLSDVAVDAHRTFVDDALRPVELTAAEVPKLTRWIQRRLGPEARIPDLGRQGWTLLGGRILPGSHGPAAFLVYANNSDRLGLTLSRSTGARALSSTRHEGSDPVSSASWADVAYDYALTSSHGSAWMARSAPSLVEAVRIQAGDADLVP
ncbi:MAG: anti-sigma factor family protein [Janthinobacterium lividum]